MSFVQYNSPEEGHKQAGDGKEGQDNVHRASLLEATEAPWQVKVLKNKHVSIPPINNKSLSVEILVTVASQVGTILWSDFPNSHQL